MRSGHPPANVSLANTRSIDVIQLQSPEDERDRAGLESPSSSGL